MCLLTLSGHPCDHAACECAPELPALTPTPVIPSGLLSTALGEMNQLLCQVMQQNSALQNYMQVLNRHMERSEVKGHARMDVPKVKGYLDLAVPAPVQVFKEKGFSLTLRVMSAPGLACTVPGLHFRIQLYTEDQPPSKVTLNISGKKVLRGSIDAYSDSEGLVSFPNIVINEVSSHYLNNCFSLVVSQSGEQCVQAFTLNGLVVKARKQGKTGYKASIVDIDELTQSS